MIERIPHTHRYRVTDDGIRRSLFLTRLHQHFLIPGIAQVTGSSPPMDTRLRAVSRAYETAIDFQRTSSLERCSPPLTLSGLKTAEPSMMSQVVVRGRSWSCGESGVVRKFVDGGLVGS